MYSWKINISVKLVKKAIIVNTINNYIYVKKARHKGPEAKEFAIIINEDMFVETATGRGFVSTENKYIFVLTVTEEECESTINVKIIVKFV